ncbi:MAG: glycosyltransferase family 2 protein [Acidimicrobiales bacterium]
MTASPTPPERVAAIVVEYRSGDALLRCVQSLRANQVEDIVVVDNGGGNRSPTESLAEPDIWWITATGNAGFGGGMNLGAAATDAELLLICNPDIELQPGALDVLRTRLLSNERAGVVGPALIDETGQVRQSARSFPSVRSSWQQAFLGVVRPSGGRSSEYRARNWKRAEAGVVDWVTGACMLVRAGAFRQIAGFDDRYFLYVEEVDFCWRIRRAGWEVLYEPRARVTHTGAVSTSAHPYRAIVTHHRSLWLFISSTTSGADRVALPIVALGLLVRCSLACAKRATARRQSTQAS